MPSYKAPLFNENNYVVWSIRMRSYQIDFGWEIWKFLVNGYEAPTSLKVDTLYNNNSTVANEILVD